MAMGGEDGALGTGDPNTLEGGLEKMMRLGLYSSSLRVLLIIMQEL